MKRIYAVLITTVLFLPLGCSSGFNHSALQLSSSDLIDYGTMAKENDMPPGTLIYGALRSGVGSNAEQHSRGELGQVTQALNGMQAIAAKSSDVEPFVEDIKRELSQTINGKVSDAMTSVNGAEALAREMEGYVKKGSAFRGRLETLDKSMQSHAGAAEFKTQSDRLIASFERLYQMGIVFAISKSQGEASAQAGLMQGALERFKTKTTSEPLFMKPGPIEIAVTQTLGKLNNLRSMITQMATINIVGPALADAVVEVGTSITSLRAACPAAAFSDAKLKPEMDDLIADAEKAKNELTTIAATFSAYEKNIKESTDSSLEALIKKGFSNEVGASLSSNKLTRETELGRFMRQLSTNKIVVLKKDRATGEFIKALGVAVAKNNAELYGLKVSNVYGLNAEALLKNKKLFNMGDKDFQGYLESMAKKANAQKSDDDVLPIIFVLFIDDLGEDIDVAPIMANLAMGKSRLVVVTDTPSRFKNKSTFASNGLDVMSGFFVAKAVVEASDPKVNASLVVEPLIKLYFGLSPLARPDLVSLPEAAKDMLLRLRDNANPGPVEVENAAKETLASGKDKVPVELATSSQVLLSSLSAVQAELDVNRSYFLDKGKTGGSTNLEEIAQLKKTREKLMKLSKLKKIMMEQNDREQKLQAIRSAHLAYKTKLEAAVPNIADLVSDYKSTIGAAQRKALNTLGSMEMLLNNDLCVFRNNEEYEANKGVDGGHKDFISRVGQQKFNPDLVKNPMQLFDIQADGFVAPKSALSGEAKAAIGLNCFLTGRQKKNQFDGQRQLKKKVNQMRAEVVRVSKEANDLAGNMTPYDPKRFSQAQFDLRERLSEDTLAKKRAVNQTYWGKNLSDCKLASGGTKARKQNLYYGEMFDGSKYLKPFPRVNNQMLPANAMAVQLPSHFIATHENAAQVGITIPSDAPAKANRNTGFFKRAPGMAPADYSVINVYGLLLGVGGVPPYDTLALAGKRAIPPGPLPAWANNLGAQSFEYLNWRIWLWFGSRIMGKSSIASLNAINPDLHKQQMINGAMTDPFARDEVFINVLFDETEQFIQDSNRSLIALYALQIIDGYKQLLERLYSLKPADVEAFLAQAPATDLSKFFVEIENILGAQSSIDDIGTGDDADVLAWWRIFFSPAVQDGIVAFAGVAPQVGTTDALLDQVGNSRWATMAGFANSIFETATLLEKQIEVIAP